VFDSDFGIAILEIEVFWVESGLQDGIKDLVLLPLLHLRGRGHND
jgi:hypothetical protein